MTTELPLTTEFSMTTQRPMRTDAPTTAGKTPAAELSSLRIARAALSRLIEPGDVLAGALLAELGPIQSMELIHSERSPAPGLRTQVALRAEAGGLGPRQRDLDAGLARWRTRRSQADGARDLRAAQRGSGGLLIPEDSLWPEPLDDLGLAAPTALWYRTAGDIGRRLPASRHCAALVGSREATDYGRRVSAEMTEDLVRHHVCVISGGAYGIDASVHRAALRMRRAQAEDHPTAPTLTAPTLAVLAGGLDRWYPAGNAELLGGVMEHGVLLSELPPGSAPTKHRFLQRNRLIAALSATTVIIEARWRSGAQNTAAHALGMDRPVGAVPGSVYSASSAGCHRLLRGTLTQVVTDAADVAELMAHSPLAGREARDSARADREGTPSTSVAPDAALPVLLSTEDLAAGRSGEASAAARQAVAGAEHRPEDRLSETDRVLADALPVRARATAGKLSEVAGLPLPQVLSGLTRLERGGHAEQLEGRWRKVRKA